MALVKIDAKPDGSVLADNRPQIGDAKWGRWGCFESARVHHFGRKRVIARLSSLMALDG